MRDLILSWHKHSLPLILEACESLARVRNFCLFARLCFLRLQICCCEKAQHRLRGVRCGEIQNIIFLPCLGSFDTAGTRKIWDIIYFQSLQLDPSGGSSFCHGGRDHPPYLSLERSMSNNACWMIIAAHGKRFATPAQENRTPFCMPARSLAPQVHSSGGGVAHSAPGDFENQSLK